MSKKNFYKNCTKTPEKWENLTLKNGFIFSKVMLNEEICKKFIQAATDLPPIKSIEYVQSEKAINMRPDSKGVRLDIYIEDEEGTVYNVEMQAIDTKELPERARYYQSMVDLELLEKGENYINIPKSVIIFICMEDIFKRGLARYTFKNRCLELDDLTLNDGTTKIFLNSKGALKNVNEDVRDFLNYLEGRHTGSEFAKKLDTEVAKVKRNESWRSDYMTRHVHETLAKREGRVEGQKEKAIEIAKKLFQKGISIDEIEKLTELSPNLLQEIINSDQT